MTARPSHSCRGRWSRCSIDDAAAGAQIWNGAPIGQSNPQVVDQAGPTGWPAAAGRLSDAGILPVLCGPARSHRGCAAAGEQPGPRLARPAPCSPVQVAAVQALDEGGDPAGHLPAGSLIQLQAVISNTGSSAVSLEPLGATVSAGYSIGVLDGHGQVVPGLARAARWRSTPASIP